MKKITMKAFLTCLFLLPGCALLVTPAEPRSVWVDTTKRVIASPNSKVTEAEIKALGYRIPTTQEAQAFNRLNARCYHDSLYMYVNSIGQRVTDSNSELKGACMEAEGWKLQQMPEPEVPQK